MKRLIALLLILTLVFPLGVAAAASDPAPEDLAGIWEIGDTLVNRLWLYEDGTFEYNVFLTGKPMGEAVSGTFRIRDGRVILDLPEEKDWLYFDISEGSGGITLIKSGVDEFTRTGGADSAATAREAGLILFRDYPWGTSLNTIVEGETADLKKNEYYVAEDESVFIRSYSDIGGHDMVALYNFENGRLTDAGYLLDEEPSDLTDYYYAYEDLVAAYTDIYGEPYEQRELWDDELYRDEPAMWGMSFATGRSFFLTGWRDRAGNEVYITISGEDLEITVAVLYEAAA